LGKNKPWADTGTQNKTTPENSIEKRTAHEELRSESNIERMQKSNVSLNSNKIPTITTTEVSALPPSFDWN
jgi:hypothetical protein